MKKRKNNEKTIVLGASIIILLVVIGFVFIQKNFTSKEEERYVSKISNKKLDINLSKKDYEIIKNEKKNNIQNYIVIEKRNLNSAEVGELTKKIAGNNNNFNIYIFSDKEKAKDFNYEENKIEILVNPEKEGKLSIKNYYFIEKEIESIPEYYVIKSIKEQDYRAFINLEIDEKQNPQKALSQMKFLGQSIKDLNKDKQIEILDIKAYYKDEKHVKWEYTSENKNLVIHDEVI